MENILAAAKMIFELPREAGGMQGTGNARLHNLLYLVQREALMERDEVMFDAALLGGCYGPVSEVIEVELGKDHPFTTVKELPLPDNQRLIRKVCAFYSDRNDWSLASMIHREYSWLLSRKDKEPSDPSRTAISLDAIYVDAMRENMLRDQAMDMAVAPVDLKKKETTHE